MNPDEIQQRALKTWYSPNHQLHSELLHPLVALAGEAGELLNLWKKDTYKPGFEAEKAAYVEELGDCLYYVAILAYRFGLTLDEVSRLNREKLKEGKHGWPEADSGDYDGMS